MLCEFCGENINRKDNLQRHIEEKHSDKIVIKCSYCQRPFSRIFNLKRHFRTCHEISDQIVDNEVKNCKKKKMSNEQFENAKRAVYVDSLYEDITPVNSPQHSIDYMYEPISDDEDWLSIDSEMERELLTSPNREHMDAIVDRILECESPEPITDDNEAEEEDNVAEDEESENPIDPAIIPPTSRTVTETVILEMTKRTITYNDGVTEIVRETEISHSETIPAEEVDVLKFATDVLSEIPEHFKNRDVKIVTLKN